MAPGSRVLEPIGKRRRIAALVSLVALVGAAAAYAALVGRARAAVVREAGDELLTLLELRTAALRDYIQTVRSETVLWSAQDSVIRALTELDRGWYGLDAEPGATLRRLYIDENPFAEGEKEGLDAAPDGSLYSSIHARVHPRVRRFIDSQGYYDAFLIDRDGNLVYSVRKEDDFGTNLRDGPWRDTGLGEVFHRSLDASEPGFVAFSAVRSYAPSSDRPSSFVASPVHDASGSRIGVLAFQITMEPLNRIMHFTEGMGRTGETYVVGPDYRMRTDSRFASESSVLRTTVDTEPVRRALAGESGIVESTSYRGARVLCAYGPLTVEGVTLAVIAEIEIDELRQGAVGGRMMLAIVILVLASTGIVVSLLLIVLYGRAARPRAWDASLERLDRYLAQMEKDAEGL